MKINKMIFFIFFYSFIYSAYSQSVLDSSEGIFNDDLSIIDCKNSVLDSNNSIFNNEKNVINESFSIFNKDLRVINDYGKEYGTFELSAEKSILNVKKIVSETSKKKSYEYAYAESYGKFIKLVADINPESKDKFVKYLSDWEWTQKDEFLAYSSTRAEIEKRIEICYNAAIGKFGIGTAIIGTVWIVSWVVPGGQVVSTAMLVIAKSTTIAALGGGAIGGITSASIAFIQGKRDDELMYVTINGAADGYLIGAITGFAQGTFTAVKNFSGAIAIEKNIYTKAGLVINKNGKTIGKTIHFTGVDNADNIYYIAKNSTSVIDKYGNEIAKIAKYKDNFVLYNQNGRILGYIGKDGQLVSYCDPSSAAIIKGQHRAQPGYKTTEEVKNLAIMNGQYNPKTGNFLDAVDGSEIIGTPEMGHINGHEYTNELQRAFANGKTEEFFREKMKDASIYQLESVSGNRGHSREAISITIDSFRGVEKDIGEELWIKLLTQ